MGELKIAEVNILPHLFEKYCKEQDKAFFVKANLSKDILKNSFGYDKEDFERKEFLYV